MNLVDRRQAMLQSGVVAAGLAISGQSSVNASPAQNSVTAGRIRYCLNTSTIRGQKVGLEQEIAMAAAAGYDGIEPWIPNIRDYLKNGGTAEDLGKRIADAGLTVDSAIGFAQWIHPDDSRRANALEEARRDMDMLRMIGGTRLAAPPVGAHSGNSPVLDLDVVTERFAALQKIGDDSGVIPQLEVWGFSTNLSRLGEVAYVAAQTGHPQSCLLLDTYHIHRGGSEFGGLSVFSDEALQVFHMNDYPATPRREELKDADRVYPGDGIAPMDAILQALAGGGRSITLSLELFNPTYWMEDAADVVKTGLQKMQASVKRAGLA